MDSTPKNMALKQTLNRKKTPARIFADLVHHPNDTLSLIAACIADQILKFSPHRVILNDILNQFILFPHQKTQIDLLLCKQRLASLNKHKSKISQETNPLYWQSKTDNHILHAFTNLYYIVINDESYRMNFHRFMQHAAMAYGFFESKKQIEKAQKQIYDFGEISLQFTETQKHNKLRAHCSWRSGERVAYYEFLRILRERF